MVNINSSIQHVGLAAIKLESGANPIVMYMSEYVHTTLMRSSITTVVTEHAIARMNYLVYRVG
jgi:hypothetical protein